jgi:hypothetical protein
VPQPHPYGFSGAAPACVGQVTLGSLGGDSNCALFMISFGLGQESTKLDCRVLLLIHG